MEHPFSATSTSRGGALAGVALACANLLLAGPAAAAPFVPNTQFTAYQIVASDGRCASALTAGAVLALTACSASNAQKYYLLYETADNDFVPQLIGAGAIARIVLAPQLDTLQTSQGQYNLLFGSAGATFSDSRSTPNADASHKWYVSRVPNPLDKTFFVAQENTTLPIAGLRTVDYGANGRFITKVIDGFGVQGQAPCTNAFFGGDPNFGIPKACYLRATDPASTPFQMTLENFQLGACMKVVGNNVGLGACDASQPTVFRLQPTSYPQ